VIDEEAARRWRILLYCGALITLLNLASPAEGLIGVPLIFFLKNKLHLAAHELAQFQVWASAPVYVAFAFGYLRDRFNPLGRGDRGYLMLFGALTASLYAGFAFAPPNYSTLLIGILFIATSILIVYSAQNGLTATLAREHLMSGQVSAVWNIVITAPGIAALLLGGALSEALESEAAGTAIRTLFLIGAALMAAIALFGVLKPKSVFPEAKADARRPSKTLEDLARLLRHRPIYPALAIWTLWSFSPGSQTPLQYHLTNTLRLSDAQYGLYNAIYSISLIPTYVLFGWLSPRVMLGRLLWWSAIVGLPGMIPLLVIHSAAGAMMIAVPIGLMAGLANAAFLDLVLRSCPKRLEGTVMMLGLSLITLSSNLGDLLGAALYDRWGDFVICVVAATASNALILLALPLVPKAIVATADGEAPPLGAAAP